MGSGPASVSAEEAWIRSRRLLSQGSRSREPSSAISAGPTPSRPARGADFYRSVCRQCQAAPAAQHLQRAEVSMASATTFTAPRASVGFAAASG